MAERFFLPAQFPAKFRQEWLFAEEVFQRILATGFQTFAYANFDVFFATDTKEKATALGAYLTENYGVTVTGITEEGTLWQLAADFPRFPLSQETLLCWAIDLLLKGFSYDCKLDGYGTFASAENKDFPDEDGSRLPWYFDEALKAYHNGNYGAAVIYFTSAIRIFPGNPNAWYSRGIVKDALYLHTQAREDYDRAIELSPGFVEAYINRGASNDYTGDFEAALADFAKAIALDGKSGTAYFNRGNTKLNMGDNAGACADWQMARELGAEHAEEQLKAHCR